MTAHLEEVATRFGRMWQVVDDRDGWRSPAMCLDCASLCRDRLNQGLAVHA